MEQNTFFWLDERCVHFEHNASNYKLAHDFLLSFIKPASFHRIQGELEPELGAYLYERELGNFFSLMNETIPRFDLILLGVGENGHCASLFPGSKELNEKKDWLFLLKIRIMDIGALP